MIYTISDLQNVIAPIAKKYQIPAIYLFGSYAKGMATPASDVDLLVCTTVTGLQFFGLVEELRERLKKKVDVLDQRQIEENSGLIHEILKDGIKIYG